LRRSRGGRTIRGSHCGVQANECRLDDEASQASGAARTSRQ
jgi:hypothetical protein